MLKFIKSHWRCDWADSALL